MIKNSVIVILLSFIVLQAKSQDPVCYKYNITDTSSWIENISCLIINDTIGDEIVKLNVLNADSGKIELIPTLYFPEKYACQCNEIDVTDEYTFQRKIKKFRPELIADNLGGDSKLLAVEFEFKRKFKILDLTGIIALRHLIPKRETLIFRER